MERKSDLRMYKGMEFLLCILFLFINGFCDEILLKNGQKAKTKIIDTIGCAVRIFRDGNYISIKKNLIEMIMWNTDSINYMNYICDEKPKKVIKFQDTPEYKLMAIIDNSPELSQTIREDVKIAYIYSPLQGSYNAEEFVGVQSALLDIIKKKYTLQVLNPSQMYDEIVAEKPIYDYAFFIKKYHVVTNNIDHSGFDQGRAIGIYPIGIYPIGKYPIGTNSTFEKKKELYTICDVVIYDVLRKEIVFRKVAVEKRSVWGESEYTWVDILTHDKWKEEWEKNQTERQLDRNARFITKRLEKEITKHLGIGE